MSINHSHYRNKYFLVLSMVIIGFSGMYFMQHEEMGKVTEPVHQRGQEKTIKTDLNTDYSQAKIEAILISKRESPIRANPRWVELEKSIANKLWSHLRSRQIDASDKYGNGEGLPSFGPPHYDVIVMLNDREKLNISVDGSMTEVFVESRELDSLVVDLRYDYLVIDLPDNQSLVSSVDKILDASVE